jgi:acyl-CoA dehydrogenase
MFEWLFREEHQIFRKSVRRFLEKEIAPRVAEWERQRALPRSVFRRFGEMGFLGLAVPEPAGGAGADPVAEAIFYEELGRYGTGGVAGSVGYHAGCALPLVASYGGTELKERYLQPSLLGEQLGGLALSEPENGSEPGKIRTVARWDGEGYRITGVKKFVTNGDRADWLCVSARIEGQDEVSLFLVDTRAAGVGPKRSLRTLGWRAAGLAEVEMHDVAVPASHLLGGEGQGEAILGQFAPREQLMLALFCIGLADAALEETIAYSKQRKQFNRTLNQFQVLQHKMVDMAVEREKARHLAYRAVYLLQQGQEAVTVISMAKAYAGEMIKQVTDAGVQIHGGMGYMMETPIQRYWRDARALSIAGGTTQSVREKLAERLQLTGN